MLRLARPREGWWTFLLVFSLVLCMPAAVVAAEWIPDSGRIFIPAVFAFFIGRWLALDADYRWDVWLPMGIAGGWLLSLSAASRRLIFFPGWGRAAFDFFQRLLAWFYTVSRGGASSDNDVFLFFMAVICWVSVLLVTWTYYRARRILLSVVLVILPAAVSVFYGEIGYEWLAAQIGTGIVILSVGHLATSVSRWDSADIDYATDLGLGLVGVSLPVALLVVSISYFTPQFSWEEVSDWFWRTFREQSEQIDDTMDRVFSGVAEPVGGPPGPAEGPGNAGLPQTRLLGGRPDLMEDVILLVWTDEPPPPAEMPEHMVEDIYEPPRHYWRGAAFDTYTGQGWSISAEVREEGVEGELPIFKPPYYREVLQAFKFTAPHGETLYALGEPVMITVPVDVIWHIPPLTDTDVIPDGVVTAWPDLAGLASETEVYTITSRLPEPMAGELRAAVTEYPEEIRDLYLQLPSTVPQRVLDLAAEVTAEGKTAFDKALLLERYLRKYPYSLEIDRPPSDVEDVADYFLFDLREGYCDYYATAFVVMARSVGIPSRLSSGYVGGYYDYRFGAWVVRENNGHSWPEVYFPGWGWIVFEPTGSQRPSDFREDSPVSLAALPDPAGPPASVVRARWRLSLLSAAGAVVIGWGAYRLVKARKRRIRSVTLEVLWSWVERGGTQIGVPARPALTVQEYASQLDAELRRRAEAAGRWPGQWAVWAEETGGLVKRLAEVYTVVLYSGYRITPPDDSELRQLWGVLRKPLRRFRWLRWVQGMG